MLVLRRKVGERVVIDGRITIVVNRLEGNRVSLGIEAPDDVRVLRAELQRTVEDFIEPEIPPAEDVAAVWRSGKAR